MGRSHDTAASANNKDVVQVLLSARTNTVLGARAIQETVPQNICVAEMHVHRIDVQTVRQHSHLVYVCHAFDFLLVDDRVHRCQENMFVRVEQPRSQWSISRRPRDMCRSGRDLLLPFVTQKIKHVRNNLALVFRKAERALVEIVRRGCGLHASRIADFGVGRRVA